MGFIVPTQGPIFPKAERVVTLESLTNAVQSFVRCLYRNRSSKFAAQVHTILIDTKLGKAY